MPLLVRQEGINLLGNSIISLRISVLILLCRPGDIVGNDATIELISFVPVSMIEFLKIRY